MRNLKGNAAIWVKLLAVAAGLAAGALPAGAQPARDPTQPLIAPQVPPGMAGNVELSLREAIALGIENNLDLEISRHTSPIADSEYDAAWGAYDPNFESSFLHSESKTPSVNPFVGDSILAGGGGLTTISQRDTGGSASLKGLLPKLGWQYDVTYDTASVRNNNSFLQPFQPQWEATLFGNAKLPVLKGFLYGEPWIQVETSGIGTGIAFQEFRQSLMDIVVVIERTYWNLAARQQDLAVARKSRETSAALVEQTNAQYEVGVVSKVEVVEAEAGLARREFDLIVADNQYRDSQDRFLDQVFGSYFAPDTTLRVQLKDRPENYTVFDVKEEEAARRAFDLRPELRIAQGRVEQQEVLLKFAKNQRLPQMDVTASYGWTGLTGEISPVFTSEEWGDVHDDFGSEKRRSWTAGVLFSMPIGNNTGRANVMKSKLELRRQNVQTRRVEQDIILEVRKAVRDLRSALEGIEASEREVDAASEQLRAEQIRLEHGESTPFQVLEKERDATDAERRRIVAYETYHNAVAELDRRQGTILRDRNVVVEAAMPMR